jgi:hypothetical protein
MEERERCYSFIYYYYIIITEDMVIRALCLTCVGKIYKTK